MTRKQEWTDHWVVVEKPHPNPEEARQLIARFLLGRLKEEFPEVFGQPAVRTEVEQVASH
ncbi:hypothetical protein [Alicyclobacillus sp. ALC3]|uniref:hypothetical protein n=1 Tax=Alicyclobacillus sp. ALC3 TaxID=2796143 RepID=UPI002379E472|nr:hypothetical protein [Alicyclobacillus sp. ALC3]WDL97839.1 hypothetical protein JC200_03655 [Alicyclobacillus sp. ALC3]